MVRGLIMQDLYIASRKDSVSILVTERTYLQQPSLTGLYQNQEQLGTSGWSLSSLKGRTMHWSFAPLNILLQFFPLHFCCEVQMLRMAGKPRGLTCYWLVWFHMLQTQVPRVLICSQQRREAMQGAERISLVQTFLFLCIGFKVFLSHAGCIRYHI